jgi:SEL1 protein
MGGCLGLLHSEYQPLNRRAFPDSSLLSQFNADRGETDFAYRLGKIFYQGSIYSSFGGIASGSEGVGAIPRDLQRARQYFLHIARQVWPHDPPNPLQYVPSAPKEDSGPVLRAAHSAGYLGRMALRGEGVKADAAVAKMWFERGALYDDKECHNGLGIIWRDGLVQGRVDLKKATTHFAIAAGQELAEAQVNLGKLQYGKSLLLTMTCVLITGTLLDRRKPWVQIRSSLLRDRHPLRVSF